MNEILSSLVEALRPLRRRLLSLGSPPDDAPWLIPSLPGGDEARRFADEEHALRSWPSKETQWWYFTGHLTAEGGEPLGFELSFFEHRVDNDRFGPVLPRLTMRRVHIAHLALTRPGAAPGRRFWFAERGGYLQPQGRCATDGLGVEIGGWSARRGEGREIVLRAGEGDRGIDLVLSPTKPAVVHGDGGWVSKGERASDSSFHCSIPRLRVTGHVLLDGRRQTVEGTAWADIEKMSLPSLMLVKAGWDWFAAQLDSGEELMVYMIKRADGSFDAGRSFATWIDGEGRARHVPGAGIEIADLGFWDSPTTGGRYPIRRRVTVEPLDLRLELEALVDEQEMDVALTALLAYWEGAMSVVGWHGGRTVAGKAYQELVGFDRRARYRLVCRLTDHALDDDQRFESAAMRRLAVAVMAALSDAGFGEAEQALVADLCAEAGLSDEERAKVRQYALVPPRMEEIAAWPLDDEERRSLYAVARRVADCDGGDDPREEEMLGGLAAALGLAGEDVEAADGETGGGGR